MTRIVGLAPVSDPSARILILGSMPGVRSLAEQQYYAHPRNHFWPLMGRILGIDPAAPYPERLESLQRCGVALWDVLQTCVRAGSLDQAIQRDSRVANDFTSFFASHPHLKLVCFNGSEAQRSFERFVMPHVADRLLTFHRLPSSSAAHAVGFERKAASWRAVLEGIAA